MSSLNEGHRYINKIDFQTEFERVQGCNIMQRTLQQKESKAGKKS